MPVPRALLIATLLFGCTPKNKHLGKVAGGALAIAGGVVVASEAMRDCGNATTVGGAIDQWACETESTTKMGVGLLAAAIGAAVFVVAARTPDEDDEPSWVPPTPATTVVEPAPQPTIEVEDPMLKQLTIQASVAARRGDCLTVQAIAARIDEMDRVYRYGYFMGDDVTASCLK